MFDVPAMYLGDGVYASWDGYHIWLDLRGQGDAHIKIALEPAALANLDRYRERINQTEKERAEHGRTEKTNEGS